VSAAAPIEIAKLPYPEIGGLSEPELACALCEVNLRCAGACFRVKIGPNPRREAFEDSQAEQCWQACRGSGAPLPAIVPDRAVVEECLGQPDCPAFMRCLFPIPGTWCSESLAIPESAP
jgi:hypothetical protein